MDLEDEWMNFSELSEGINNMEDLNNKNNEKDFEINNLNVPKSSDIYISTKTKICYFNRDINLFDIFWKLKLIQYYENEEGIIKKQMKFNSLSREDFENTISLIENEKNNNFVEETLIQHLDTHNGNKIRFKDIRKVSVGISKKDIMSYRSKPKSAFYNCFVILIRILFEDKFKEVHVKIFNTGKIEIPGIQSDELFEKITKYVKNIMIKFDPNIDLTNKQETVLINSNFTCGYLINRDILFKKLKNKYKINASYDPCSYPGIQCKYKIKGDNNINYELSFMIFRTGSILIVGKCNEQVLISVYEYLKEILHNEYNEIYQKGELVLNNKNKNRKIRKKKIRIL